MLPIIRVAIVGARGFVGGELLRLGLQHPFFRITHVTSESQVGMPVAEAFPGFLGLTDLHFTSFDDRAADEADAVFFALPDGEAMARVEPLLKAGKRVVDISGDFRVRSQPDYERWYGRAHASPHLLSKAVYGLPEIRPDVRDANLIANPGCYPSAILLAVAPLFSARIVEPDSLVADAKSGVSGAGGRSSMDPAYSFAAISDNFRAYGVVGHRHTAEMEQELSRLCGAPVTMTFTPHLLPVLRGILATCYVRLTEERTDGDLLAMYREFYRNARFVQVLKKGLPELRFVSGSNACHVAVRFDARARRAICVSAIDNLVKGAAGSAIQNMNLISGLEEATGLTLPATGP
jgi:N-acetyl-gamma-glutamyl-phosphate reductase